MRSKRLALFRRCRGCGTLCAIVTRKRFAWRARVTTIGGARGGGDDTSARIVESDSNAQREGV